MWWKPYYVCDFFAQLINININIDYSQTLLKMGALEEFFIHEGVHGAPQLEQFIRNSGIWGNAVKQDAGKFISEYAKENAKSEDIAESFLGWLVVKGNNIDKRKIDEIKSLIPARLNSLDRLFDGKAGILIK